MENRKSIKIIKTFSKEELVRFENFLESPFFMRKDSKKKISNDSDAKNLYSILHKNFAKIQNNILTFSDLQKLYLKRFSKKKSIGALKNLLNDLAEYLEKYLKLLDFENDYRFNKLALINQYANRGLILEFFDRKEKLMTNLLKIETFNIIDIFFEFELMNTEYNINSTRKRNITKTDQIKANQTQSKLSKQKTLFFFLSTFHDYIMFSSQASPYNSKNLKYNFPNIKIIKSIKNFELLYFSLIEKYRKNDNEIYEVLLIYYLLFKASELKIEQSYNILFEIYALILKNIEKLQKDVKHIILGSFQNLLDNFPNSFKKTKTLKIDLYNLTLKNFAYNFNSEQNEIDINYFIFFLLRGIDLDWNWTVKFYSQYFKLLKSDVKNSIKIFFDALILLNPNYKKIAKEDLIMTRNLLDNNFTVNDVSIERLKVKRLFILSYIEYELENYNQSRKHLSNIISHLENNYDFMSERNKKITIYDVGIMRKLINIKLKDLFITAKKNIILLQNKEKSYHINWILSKLNEIKS